MHDMRRVLQRQAHVVLAELFGDAQVHLVVGEPQRDFGDARRPFVDFDAVELIDVGLHQLEDVQVHLARIPHVAQHFQFQQTQFAVGDDQEVAAAAGGVHEAQRGELFQELKKFVLVAFDLVEFGPERIQKQRADQPQDVGFAGVVGADGAARVGRHDALEQRAEHGRRDAAPVHGAAVEQGFAHGAIEGGDRQRYAEQLAVDVGESGELFVQRLVALVRRGIQHLPELGEVHTEIAAVLAGAAFEVVLKLTPLEDGGVFGEQAEQRAHQKNFQHMTVVTGGFELVVQLAQECGRLGVDRVFLAETARLVAGDKTEQAHLFVQVGEGEFEGFSPVEIVQTEAGEVGNQHIARQVALFQAGEVVHRLPISAIQILAARFVLNQQHAAPEQVDEAALAVRLLDRLLEAGQPASADAEHVEEAVPETLGFRVLGGVIRPFAGKGQGAILDFVPGEGQGL